MCVEKTRAYVKNKKGILNAVVGWGRPVYAGEENLALLSKGGVVTESTTAVKPIDNKPAVFKPIANGANGSGVKTIQTLLGIKADESLTYFSLQKFLNKHYIKTQ